MFLQAIGRIFRWLGGDHERERNSILETLGCMADQTADQLRGFHREIVDLTFNTMTSGRSSEAFDLQEIGGELLMAAHHLDRVSCQIELLEVNRRARERRTVSHG